MQRLKKRSEFLAVARGWRAARRAVVVQALQRGDASGPPRVGFTVTKRVGNAVERNRIRRRLKAAVERVGVACSGAGTDFVLVGRRAALNLPFDMILKDLRSALAQLAKSISKSQQGV